MRNWTLGFLLLWSILFSGISPVIGYGLSGSFTDMSESTRQYTSYDGQYLFLEAFATGCGHCKNQHPILVQLYDTYKSNAIFLSIAVWNTQETQQTLKDYNNQYPASWTVGIDSGTLKNQLSVSGTPTMFLLDQAGEVIKRWDGETPYEDMAPFFDKYILEKSDVILPTETTTGTQSSSNNDSIIGRIFGNVIFQVFVGISILSALYFRSIKK